MLRKLSRFALVVTTAIASVFVAGSVFGQVTSTETSCVKIEGPLRYSCEVMLLQAGAPVSDARIVAGADMPTMPLAHNVRPVEAVESEQIQGQYTFEIEIEMFGEWRFIYDIFEPFRDRLHEKLTLVQSAE